MPISFAKSKICGLVGILRKTANSVVHQLNARVGQLLLDRFRTSADEFSLIFASGWSLLNVWPGKPRCNEVQARGFVDRLGEGELVETPRLDSEAPAELLAWGAPWAAAAANTGAPAKPPSRCQRPERSWF